MRLRRQNTAASIFLSALRLGAGILLVRESGGVVTDFTGKEWNLDSKDMTASNGKVHKNILKITSKL